MIENRYNLSYPKGVPVCSVAIATHNKAKSLEETLASIFDLNTKCPFSFEVVVVDDKSTDNTFEVCKKFDVTYARLPQNPRKNPSVPRNLAFRIARGKVIVHQSDEVVHNTEDSLEKLVNLTEHNNFVIATVYNVHPETKQVIETYTGCEKNKPYFFLGSVTKRALDICGGYDEDFIGPGYDDDKLADDLVRVGARPIWTNEVVGLHLDHPKGNMSCGADSAAMYYGRKLYDTNGGTNV